MTEEQARELIDLVARRIDEAFERGAERIAEAVLPDPVSDARTADMQEDIRKIREQVDALAQLVRDGAING